MHILKEYKIGCTSVDRDGQEKILAGSQMSQGCYATASVTVEVSFKF
jgi:hypothetical protein